MKTKKLSSVRGRMAPKYERRFHKRNLRRNVTVNTQTLAIENKLDQLFQEGGIDLPSDPLLGNETPSSAPAQGAKAALDRILAVDPKDINRTFLEKMFAGYHDKSKNTYHDPLFKPDMRIQLTPQQYPHIKEPIETTLGLLVMNRYLLEQFDLLKFIGYQNTPIDSKGLDKLNTKINDLVILDKIDCDTLVNYIDARDRLGFWCAAFLATSITPALLLPMENVNKRKAELFKQRQAELQSDNAVTQVMANNEIEKELMGIVRENLKNDPGYDFYRSGDGNLDNNYKTINVMRGAVFDEGTKRYQIVDSSLMEGIKPRDITPFANSIIAGAYPSAVGTAEAGYMSKQLIALTQSEHINPDPNSDCGTQATIPVMVTEKNKQYLIFRNIKEGNKIKETTLENIGDYVGKTIQMYSPQCCTQKTICAKCAGTLFYHMAGGNVVNIGCLTSIITKKMLDLKLKSKHDLSQNAGFMDASRTFLHGTENVEVTEHGTLRTKRPLKLFVPKYTDDVTAYYIEATEMHCLGVMPAKFYDDHGNEVLSTTMTVPTMIDLKLYQTPQEDMDNYIIEYEAGADICSLAFAQNIANVCAFFELEFLHSKVPLIPYPRIPDMMFRNMELNKIDLTGPSFIYELLARRLCRNEDGSQTFAFTYGKNPNVDPMSYTKLAYREAVQRAGAIQAMLFEDISKGINVNLANTLNGVETEDTPFDKIMRA